MKKCIFVSILMSLSIFSYAESPLKKGLMTKLLLNSFSVSDLDNIINDEVVTFDYVTRIVSITVQPGYYFSGYVQVCNGNETSVHSCIIKQFPATSNGGVFTVKAPSRGTQTDLGVVVSTSSNSYFFPY